MIESYRIHFSLNKEKSIDHLQSIIFRTFEFSNIEAKSLKWIYEKAIDGSEKWEQLPDFLSYYNQISFDYKGNDFGVPANIFIEFYSQSLNKNSKQFYISGFNNAGSEFVNLQYKTVAESLIIELSRQDFIVDVIYTYDSIYQTPQLFQIANKLELETGIRGILRCYAY